MHLFLKHSHITMKAIKANDNGKKVLGWRRVQPDREFTFSGRQDLKSGCDANISNKRATECSGCS